MVEGRWRSRLQPPRPDRLAQDIRFAWRQLRRSPGFTATAALTLALGIGANTAIFSVINGYTRPLPVPDPDQIVVMASSRADDETGLRFKVSFPAIQDYRAQTTRFTDIMAFDLRVAGLAIDGTTTSFLHQAVTGNFFSGLRLTPAAGRFFEPGEGEVPNAEPLIVLGHAFWQRRFGANAAVVGTAIRLNGRGGRIIGVAPEGFRGMVEGAHADGYTTIGVELGFEKASGRFLSDRSIRRLTMFGRLQPGVTSDEAQAEMDVIARALAARYPDTEHGETVRVIAEPLARPRPIPFLTNLLLVIRRLLLILTLMVLTIACMNVANLLLIRASVRQAEMAVRSALGAGRHSLIRLLLVESCLLSVLGAGLGLLLGKWVSVAFADSINIGTDIPVHVDFQFDWRVFAFTLTTALVTGLIAGVLPAWRATRVRVADLLHDGGRGGSSGAARQRTRNVLVAAQVAGSVALLVVAGLFVRNLREAQRIDLGFDPAGVLTLRLDTTHAGYDATRSIGFYAELENRIAALPGVESVSTSFTVPLGYVVGGASARPEGDRSAADHVTAVGYNSVTRTYLDTLKIPILEGRGFTEQDTAGAPRVAIVNQVLAERFWPGQNSIGKRIEIPSAPGAPWEVVGIARNSKYLAVFEWPLPYFYVPQAQDPSFLRALEVRSSLPFADISARVRQEIATLAPDLPIADVRPLGDVVTGNFGFVLFRVGVWQATAMGILGLVLATVGVYGVVSYRTTQRAREIGIRMALGAVPADVGKLVLRQGVLLVLAGAGAGALVTAALGGAFRGVLVFVSATDPLAFALATTLVSGTALAACYMPARRAMRLSPTTLLRHE